MTSPALAAATAEETAKRWMPGLSMYFAGLPEERSASADSELTVFQDGETTGFPWSIGVEAEIATPVLLPGPMRPRLSLHGGAGYVIDSDDPVSTFGDPGGRPFVSPSQPDPASIENQGAAVRAQSKSLVLTGGIGSALEFEVFDRTLHLRPSLEWMYRRDTIQAILGAGEAEALDVNGNCAPCRILYIDAQQEKGYHSLGLGLDAALDGGRAGDFLVRFFASGRAYHILGDRKTAFSPEGTWERTDGMPTNRADPTTEINARYEREPFHFRVGVGVRLLWLPE